MRTLKVGIIGQGRSGYGIHAMALERKPEKFLIAAVSDPDEENRRRAERQFGCDAYDDYKKLMERKDLDLVVNASPSHLHVPISLEFLEAGFHVLCEKPLARTIAEADALIAASERTGRMLTVFQQSRYAPAYQEILRLVRSGKFGRIIQISVALNRFARRWDWQTLQENYGGNLLNNGSHPLDQVLHLVGTEELPKIRCFMDRVNTFGDAEDYVKLIMHWKGLAVADLEVSSCDAFPPVMYRIQMQYGGIMATETQVKWKYFDPERAPKQRLIRTPLKNPDGTPAYGTETLPWTEGEWNLPEGQRNAFQIACDAYYDRLYEALVKGSAPEVTPQQVKQQIAIIEECHRQNPLPRLEF